MTRLDLYISRKPAEKWLEKFGKALEQPQDNPLVFYTYGIGGIGKSTLLEKLRETYAKEAHFAKVFFGTTSRIDSPLILMEHLYNQLPDRDDGWGEDTFTELCKKYRETLHQLETEPAEGRGSVSPEQVGLVKKLLGGATKMFASWHMPDPAAEQWGNVAEGVVDVATLALSEKDRIEQILKQHRATRNKRELQELMRDPLPKLTQAFAEGVIQKSQSQPIVLMLDTYEKASSEFDVFLCKYLLGDTALASHPVRMVMAGRFSLKNKRYHRMFQQHWDLICECQLERFDKNETKEYLKEIGIDQPKEIRRVTRATKGFPYFLKLIKDQKEDGRSINTLRDSDEIVDRLLDGLMPTERKVVQLAAYCRWFDRPIIQYLVRTTDLADTNQSAEEQLDWFDWLIERDFVISEEKHQIDDVARDVIRAAEHRADEQNFRHIHDLLAQYFQKLADQEVASDCPVPAKYENSDWRKYAAEIAYHALFANRDQGQFRFLTYFFEGAHLNQPDIAITALAAIAAEAEPANHDLLPKDTQRFLDSIQFAVIFGWRAIDKNPRQYEFNIEKSGSDGKTKTESLKSQIESALEKCFQKVDRLTGLAKYAGLIGKSLRCHPSQRLAFIQQAREEAEKVLTLDYLDFSSDLFLNIGNGFFSLDLHQEALESYEKAIELKPDDYRAWNNKGSVLQDLERYEEALESCDKALTITKDAVTVWNSRGLCLSFLQRYDEAIDNLKRASELEQDEPLFLANQGIVLARAGRYEEAFALCEEALKLKENEAGHYAKACSYALQGHDDLAIESLKQAIEYEPHRCRSEAKRNPDFDRLRDNEKFQALMKSRN